MTPPTLRAYQLRAIRAARRARRAGHRRILLVAPTGSGKSVIGAAIIANAVTQFGAKALVIGHRKEIISQFYVHLQRAGVTPGIMRGDDERTDDRCSVQVGTVQTLGRRQLPGADIVFIDEAHRATGDSYARILAAYPKATIFGLTATPCRLDGSPLREHFDTLIEVASYSELIEEGAILAPILYVSRMLPDVSKVRKVAGDYNEGQLADASMKVVGDIVDNWVRKAENRKTVCFAVNIEHSLEIVGQFTEAGVRATHIDASTPDDVRDQALLDLETGRIQVLSNVGILCEGWDQPSVKCCIMARPTLSLTLWMQCAGRILRPHPGSLPPLILDHAGNVNRQGHGAPHEDREWSLDGKAKSKSKTVGYVCQECYAYVDSRPCPLCGWAPAPGQPSIRRGVQHAGGVLERIDAGIARDKAAVSSDPKRRFYDAAVEKARKRGFKPGYAAAQYREEYGQKWPPWAWSQETKKEYERDPEWQERVAKHIREREFWQAQKSAQAATAPVDAAVPEEPGDHPWMPSEDTFDVSDL